MLCELNFITIWVSNSITEFWAEDRIKDICESETLIDQERHLALEMLT
jgi:hypothetical protein